MARIAGFATWTRGDAGRRRTVLAAMQATMPGGAGRDIALGPADLAVAGPWGSLAEADGHAVVVDGRILNARELGGDAAGDAALVLRLALRHGFEESMRRLEGDLAVAWFGGAAGRLRLGRDRFGVKPLYYAAAPGGGAGFASMPAALLRLPGIDAAIDRQYAALVAGSHYRTFDNAPERSPFAGVAQLPAAHVVEIGPDGPGRPHAYWRLGPCDLGTDDPGQLAERYRGLLQEAVHARVALADRPAFTLSGGMDSSSVACSAARMAGRPVAAWSSVYVDPTYDERNEIRDVIDAGLADWTPVELTDDLDVPATVARLVAQHHEPVATATWLAHDAVCRQVAAAGHDVLFGGLGGDELNAGEYEYFPLFFADLAAAGANDQLAHEIACWAAHHDHPIHRKDAAVARRLMAELTVAGSAGHCRPNRERQMRYAGAVRPDFFDLAAFEPVMEHPFAGFLANRAYQDLTRETTPCCLRAEDRQSAAHGLEHLDPFLDRALVEFMFSVPPTLKIRDGITKRLLREAMREVLPEATRGRIKKTGWNAPAHRWFTGAGLDSLRDLVASRRFRERGIYDVAAVNRLIDDHADIVASDANRENHMMFLWQLVNLEAWLDWIDAGTPPAGAAGATGG